MSGISRRSILGYTGTAATGTILATAGSAQAAQPGGTASASTGATGAVPASAHTQQAAAETDFTPGTEFTANAHKTFPDGSDDSYLTVTFTVQCDETPADHVLTPVDIANALSAYVQSKGWPSLTFYGAPAPVALN